MQYVKTCIQLTERRTDLFDLQVKVAEFRSDEKKAEDDENVARASGE